MRYLPPSARRLAQETRQLSQDLELATGQPGMTCLQSAVGVVDVLATTVRTAATQVSLVAEYVREECEAGRVRATDEFPDTGVTQAKGMAFLAARAAVPALEHAATALTTMHDAISPLESTHAPLGEAAPATEHQARIAAAMNLVLAALLGDTYTLTALAKATSSDDTHWLARKLEEAASTLGHFREERNL